MVRLFSIKLFPAAIAAALILCAAFSEAKTRWSSLHLTPDADFLSGGQFVTDAHAYYFSDSVKGAVVAPTVLAGIGIMDWVNMELGYAGGPTLGFKARLLNENQGAVPSLAIGARNIFKNKETYYFHSKDTLGNQFYIALSKSIDALRMRLHAGMLTIPTSKDNQVDPFVTLEEYFGAGLYGSIEVEKVKKDFLPSLFLSYRLLKKHLEISAGAVALNKLLFDKNNKFSFSLTSADSMAFVKPGLWFGIRYCATLGFSKSAIFMSVDDRVKQQQDAIDKLRGQVDSLRISLNESQVRMAKVDNSLLTLSDSIYSDKNRFRAALYDKIIALKTLYETEPFDPELARQSIRKITALKETSVPVLKEFIIDKKQDRRVRLLSISLLGEMAVLGASDVLLDVLSQSEDPEIKIEILIALGKMKETRAIYVMEQLANDPTDVVAFTAQEVLMKLVREKGIKLSSDLKMRKVIIPETSVMKEEKLPVQKTKSAPVKPTDSLSLPPNATQPAVSMPPKNGSPQPIVSQAPLDSKQKASSKESFKTPATQPRQSSGKTVKADSADAAKTSAKPDTAKAGQNGKGSDDVWGVQPNTAGDSAQQGKSDNASVKSVTKDTSVTSKETLKTNTNASSMGADSASLQKVSQSKPPVIENKDSAAKKKGKTDKKSKQPKAASNGDDDKNW